MRSDVVFGSGAAVDAVVVAGAALAAVVELAGGARGNAVGSVADVLAARAVSRAGSGAHAVALVVAVLARFVVELVDAEFGIAAFDARVVELEVGARQTLVGAQAPAALVRTLRIAH